MIRITLFIILLLFSLSGITKTDLKPYYPNSNIVVEEDGDFGDSPDYGVLTFTALPDPEILIDAGIVSLNYINARMIYAYVPEVAVLESIDGYVNFEPLDIDAKICSNIDEFFADDPVTDQAVVIYLPPGFTMDEVIDFCSENSIERIESEYLPHFIIATETNLDGINSLKNKTIVSWIMKAPEPIFSGRPFHLCLGAHTPYGFVGEFGNQGKYELTPNTEGGDGPGLGCADVTYHFIDGTPDIAGTLEHNEVVRAIREYEKYVQVNYWETDLPDQYYSMDIQWTYVEALHYGLPATARPPGSWIHSGNMHFNEHNTWDLNDDENTWHLFTIALHEAGHTLGLNHHWGAPGSVMFGWYDGNSYFEELDPDDIAGIRALHATRNIQEDENDQTFVANVTGDDNLEIVMVNTSYHGGAIRVDDIQTGENILWKSHCDFTGWMENTDRMFLADANGDGYEDLVLVNTHSASFDGAIRVINLNTGLDHVWVPHGGFGGWMGPDDRMFVANVDETPQDELILVNTNYAGGAVMAVDLSTGSVVSTLDHTGTFAGWMDASDRMLMGDVNDDGREDLVMLNTSYGGGAIRAIDVTTGVNLGWLNHTGEYDGWMDTYDKVALADMNNDMKDELILVNTSYTGGAVKVINVQTGVEQSYIPHGTFGGWMSLCDRMFMADVNNDDKEDLVLVNNSGGGDAIRAIDLTSGSDLVIWPHDGDYGGWMSNPDRMFCEDVNADGQAELIMINSIYAGGAIKTTTIIDETHLSEVMHTGTYNGWIDGISPDQNCNDEVTFKTGYTDINEDATTVKLLGENQLGMGQVKIYPNPTNNFVNIEFNYPVSAGTYFQIFNIYGQAVTKPIVAKENVNQVDLSEFGQGNYIIEIVHENHILRRKVTTL